MLRCEPELAGCLHRLGCVRAACWTPSLLLACLARDGAHILLFSPSLGLQLAAARREPTPVSPVLGGKKVLHPLQNILRTPNRLHLRAATLFLLLNLIIFVLDLLWSVLGLQLRGAAWIRIRNVLSTLGPSPSSGGDWCYWRELGHPWAPPPTHKAPQLLRLGVATGWHLSMGRLVCFDPSRGAAESSGHVFGCSPATLPV